jgi:hypothetical protein
LHGNIFHFLASLALVGTTVPMTLVGKSWRGTSEWRYSSNNQTKFSS